MSDYGKRYTRQFKEEAVRLLVTGGTPPAGVLGLAAKHVASILCL